MARPHSIPNAWNNLEMFILNNCLSGIIIHAKNVKPNETLFHISTKVRLSYVLSSKATYFGLPNTYLNILFSEITTLLEPFFHMEYLVDKTI